MLKNILSFLWSKSKHAYDAIIKAYMDIITLRSVIKDL